jgi:LmbE family N-acetylglucosaminyl deacetylase
MTSTSLLYRALARGAHAATPSVLVAWRQAALVAAVDDTIGATARSCMVVAPHPDDETLGCGALIARKRAAGTRVTVVIVADGRHAQRASSQISPARLAEIRAEEAVAACAELGVAREHVVQLGHEDTRVAHHEERVTDRLGALLREVQPEEVLVVSGLDHHIDHRAVNRATHRALARWSEEPVVREYPVWSWIDGPWLDQAARRSFGRATHLVSQPLSTFLAGRPTVVVTADHIDHKRRALAAHASQTTPYTDEPGWAVMDEALLSPFLGPVEIFLSPTTSRRYRTC